MATTTSIEQKGETSFHALGDYEKRCLEQYRSYWTREEEVDGIDLSQEWNEESLLKRVQEMLHGSPKLIQRTFKNVMDCDEGSSTIRVMTWNILAQGLCQGKDNFSKCPAEALQWNRRRLLILEEILRISPDVACLQEVDHYGFLNQVLAKIGYEGTFFPKPDSPALYTRTSDGPDGCALFYRKSKVCSLDRELLILKNIKNDMRTNQVCILHKLQIKSGKDKGKVVCVGTTHLKAKHGEHNMKTRQNQGSWLLQHLATCVREVPLIIAGDFNAEPTEPVYLLFSKSNQKLDSTYRHLSEDNEDAAYTTWKIRDNEVCSTIDYIWYTNNSLKLKAILELPTEDQIGENRLPAFHYPSDHIALAADYTF